MNRWKGIGRFTSLWIWMALLLAGCGDPSLSALQPKGPMAEEQLSVIKLSIGVMILVIVVVLTLYVFVLFKFRRRKGDESIPEQVEGNHILEVVWTVIPIILLLIIAVPTIYYTFKHSQDYRNDPDALLVKVTGHQYWWEFEYPDYNLVTAQDLVIPVGKKVALEVVSADVNHSFWVPVLGGKIDANASQTNVWHYQADVPGVYAGKCTELCGPDHALMDFKVVAVTPEEFEAWVADMTAPATVSADVAQGEQLFRDNCLTCHAITPSGKSLGPNLNGFANRQRIAGFLQHTTENLKDWIADPQRFKEDAKMPAFAFDESEMDELVKFLEALK